MRLLGSRGRRNWGIYSFRIRRLLWRGGWGKLHNFIAHFLPSMDINQVLPIELLYFIYYRRSLGLIARRRFCVSFVKS